MIIDRIIDIALEYILSGVVQRGILLIKVSKAQYDYLKKNGTVFKFEEAQSLNFGLKLTSNRFRIVITTTIADWAGDYLDSRNRLIDISRELFYD